MPTRELRWVYRALSRIGFLTALMLLGVLVIWPHIDVNVSNWFFEPKSRFYLSQQPVLVFFHWLAVYGAWGLGILFALLAIGAAVAKKNILNISSKHWLFLFVALILGPVLIANVGFKDHWGRARPRDIGEFGGTAIFSPALIPQPVIRKNGSFIAGDPSFGFYLPALAYLVPPNSRQRRSRRIFWLGIATGCGFGFVRLAMGAHFLSDILFAALFMILSSAGVHALMFGRQVTAAFWREWMFDEAKVTSTH